MKVYVDVDGVLLDGSLDRMFINKKENEGFEIALEWYENKYVDNLIVNKDMINELNRMKGEGFELVLWTNRGVGQKDMTINNLGKHIDMFSDVIFGEGNKRECCNIDSNSIVIDNEHKNLIGGCGWLVERWW
jgi:histidinol phosphatase-like enzyme